MFYGYQKHHVNRTLCQRQLASWQDRNMTRHMATSCAILKLFPIEVTRDEFNSFALILSPVQGASHEAMPAYERVGHVSIDRFERKRRGGVDHGDECMQRALATAEHGLFCIV